MLPSQDGGTPSSPEFLGPTKTTTRVVHGDQTTREENFYTMTSPLIVVRFDALY